MTLSMLPRSAEIRDVAVRLFFDPRGSELTADELAQLLDAATPVAAGDPSIAAWHNSPWAEGTFSTAAGVWRIQLFLAGRGRLESPDGEFGYLDVQPSVWQRIADAHPASHR